MTEDDGSGSLWGGRFAEGMAPGMVPLNRCLPVDGRLWRQDVRGSIAWARALGGAGVLTDGEVEELVSGLDTVARRLSEGGWEDAPEEDIHSLVERMLGEEVGSLAGKLHTGRSRNDQSATDVRLWGMEAVDRLVEHLESLVVALADQAEAGREIIMPGYTHLQQGQPVRLAQWALAHAHAFLRDRRRLRDAREAAAVLPLGSGAIAGCPFPVDRDSLRRELGFRTLSANSIDAVSDRDWICDLVYAGAMIGMHLSRLGEDLILFSSREFGFLRLADGYSTGSSLMPQKRNPDAAELARGKAGRLSGNLQALLVLLKSLPTGYNRDLQEDKEPLFDTVDTLEVVLPAMAGTVSTARPQPEAIRAAMDTELLATDLADYLVRQGVPFRESHEVVGRLVRRAEEAGRSLAELEAAVFAEEHPAFEADVVELFDWERSVESRDSPGGSSLRSVDRQLGELRRELTR